MINMIRQLLLIITSIFPIFAFAQTYVTSISQKFQIMPAPLPKFEVIDTTIMEVLYRFTYPCDDFKGNYTILDDIIALQIANSQSKTFSHNLHIMDCNLSCKKKIPVKFRLDYNDFEVFNNITDGIIRVQRRIPYSRILQASLQVVEYSYKPKNINWEFKENNAQIAGYECLYASAEVAGRKWNVWFTLEIPVSANLWQFYGLPGLILKAESDDGLFCFECTEIKNVKSPIYYYNWNAIKMKRSKWLKTEKHMYEYPSDFFSKNGEISILDINTRKPIENEWRVKYYPLEK